jgi:hypothetical protein
MIKYYNENSFKNIFQEVPFLFLKYAIYYSFVNLRCGCFF